MKDLLISLHCINGNYFADFALGLNSELVQIPQLSALRLAATFNLEIVQHL